MPRGDGTGPRGQGPGTARGLGKPGGGGQGRQGGFAAGPGGYCVCPKCNVRVANQVGVPCFRKRCPTCGATMMRA